MRRNRVEVPCDMCGVIMSRKPSAIERHNFCSRACTGKWQHEHPRGPTKPTTRRNYRHEGDEMNPDWTIGANKKMGVYAVTHIASKRVYIGSAVNVGARWRLHKSQLMRGIHGNIYLQRAWNKYGAAAFSWTILEVVGDKSALRHREQEWIDTLRTTDRHHGFNLAVKAQGGGTGAISERQKQQISKALMGNKHGQGKHCHGVLSEDEVRAILLALADGADTRMLTRQFSVSKATILRIGRRVIWWNVAVPPDVEARLAEQPWLWQKRGARNPKARLREVDVIAIRTRRANGAKACDLAQEYGVTAGLISAICVRRVWKHIP